MALALTLVIGPPSSGWTIRAPTGANPFSIATLASTAALQA